MFSRITNWLGSRFVAALGDHEKAGPLKRRLGALFLEYFPGQIRCDEFESFVFDYHEGVLSEKQRKRFEFHMRICPMCDSAFQAYVRTVELTGRLFDDSQAALPGDVPQGLINAMLVSRRDSEA